MDGEDNAPLLARFDERKKLLWHRQVLSSLADLAKVCGIRQYQRRSIKGGAAGNGEVGCDP